MWWWCGRSPQAWGPAARPPNEYSPHPIWAAALEGFAAAFSLSSKTLCHLVEQTFPRKQTNQTQPSLDFTSAHSLPQPHRSERSTACTPFTGRSTSRMFSHIHRGSQCTSIGLQLLYHRRPDRFRKIGVQNQSKMIENMHWQDDCVVPPETKPKSRMMNICCPPDPFRKR